MQHFYHHLQHMRRCTGVYCNACMSNAALVRHDSRKKSLHFKACEASILIGSAVAVEVEEPYWEFKTRGFLSVWGCRCQSAKVMW